MATEVLTFRVERDKALRLKALAQEMGVAVSPLVDGLVDSALAAISRNDILAAAQAMARAEGDMVAVEYRSDAWNVAKLEYESGVQRLLSLMDQAGL